MSQKPTEERFRPFPALTTLSLNVHTQIIRYRSHQIHACLIDTSNSSAPAPLSGAALTEGTLRDPLTLKDLPS